MRCFIAVDLPAEIKKELEKIQKSLPEFKGKLTERQNLHLTFKFLGEISEEQVKETKERLKRIKLKKFKARLGKVWVFTESSIRIVWINLENCDALQKEIDSALEGLFAWEKNFTSHITLARVKAVKDTRGFLDDMKKLKAKPMEFEVAKFSFKKSTLTEKGPIYEDIAEFSLG